MKEYQLKGKSKKKKKHGRPTAKENKQQKIKE